MATATGSRPLVVAVRVLVLLVAIGGLTIAVTLALRKESVGAVRQYVCPMHPEVTAAVPGECPICRMELEAVSGANGSGHEAAVGASTFQVYDDVRRRGFGPQQRAPASVGSDGFVSALLYDDEIATLTPNQGAVFSFGGTPMSSVEVVSSPDPAEPWDASTSRVRFRVVARATAPARGTVGWVKLAGQRVLRLTIPSSAVLEGADGAYVLVASADGRTLSRRGIGLGRTLGGTTVVASGLRDHERVLTRNAFFVDAERRLRREATVDLTP